MLGSMMDSPLTITAIMRHAEQVHADTEIVSFTNDNPRHRCTFKEAFRRARKLANVFHSLGIAQGDRIGTLAWNDYRHFEIYYATAGYGAVCHTVNPRLFAEQISYIVNHGNDKWIFADLDFVPVLESIQAELTAVEGFVLLCPQTHMPETSLDNVKCYETLLEDASDCFDWPELDEKTASAMCYTSGTTGNPKGVLYNHRSTVLHAMMTAMVDTMAISNREVVLAAVPMFHVNAWGSPYVCAMVGAKMVLPGSKAGDGATLAALINEEKVTYSMGVPTIWLALDNYLEASGDTVESLKRVVVGGAACPLSLQKAMEKHGVWIQTAWGMTETGPLGVYNTLMPWMEQLPEQELDQWRGKAGRAIFGVEMKIVDDQGATLLWDGETAGTLKVRGPWVCNGYYGLEGTDAHDSEGWFDTGDVATIDEYGYLQITDRTKDVIKSGGEWISSIELENAAMGHPAVAEAAVIGIPHPKWTERPLLVVVKKEGEESDGESILASLEGKVAKWWIPGAVAFVDKLPHTATGKLSKKDLRAQFSDYRFPGS